MGLLEHRFCLSAMPDYFGLLKRGYTIEEANAIRVQALERIQAQLRYFNAKPTSGLRMRRAEERVLDELGGPVQAFFRPDPPSGVSLQEHVSNGITAMVGNLTNEIMRVAKYKPTCALIDPEASHFLDMTAFHFRAQGGPHQDWRGRFGRLLNFIEVHREPDCEEPYLLPRGELWLMMAWRYEGDFDHPEEWARPVGILRFEGYTDHEMVHIAKCAR
jgi:hypothetical protein